jgi:hypothetical protein
MAERSIHIFYRHVHSKSEATSRDPNKARPAWFTHEACFANLLRTIAADPNGACVKITIMYDGTLDDFMVDWMAKYYGNEALGLKIQFLTAGSDKNSALITLHYAHTLALPPTDIVYFVENDYVHQQGWVTKVLDLYRSGIAFDYVGLYDHGDKYILDMYRDLTCKLVHAGTQHWRTAPSTCATYMVEKRVFDRDYAVFAEGLPDYYLFTKLINEMGRVLLTPVPGLATHSMEGYLSPTVDWARLV